MDDTTTTIAITAAEVEAIVQKVVSLAVMELKELFNNKLSELNDRVASAESRILILEAERNTSIDQSHLVPKSEIMDELNNLRAESRETLLNANDNEQYSRGNNLRICGLSPDTGADCRSSAISFVKNVMHINSINESNIEVAHMITRSVQLPDSHAQRRRPVMLVRFTRKDDRDTIIRARKVLKGTRYAITEDLTGLNMKTMNRLRNHDQVRTVWSWNGKILAILSNGHKVVVKPFQPVSELLTA